ncbi:MAG TPA: serine/threonine-protein kinase [Polyangiaceae bacterium]|nr:serine/threonine-protein kinase [Polyangiaceae bacterium]
MFPQIFGKYVLEREIAAGGMARVYLATLRGAVGFEKRLVVKQIRPELACDEGFVIRFVEEAKTAVELSHPNIVPVYELGVEQGVYYIAMELCEGLTLSELLAETGPLGPAEGAYVGAEICRALDYAHRRARIVHRDVTPRNVLIDDEGAVRLIDFGIAAPVAPNAFASDAARREVFGSPGHMPPEQLHGAELTPATDVFAVGALLIEAWSGQPPFRRATAQESERALFSVPAPIDERQPSLAPLRELIASSIALDARERPLAAEHLARPLREFLKSEDSGDIARRLGQRVRQARRRARASNPWLPGEGSTGKNNQSTRPVSDGAGTDRESASAGAPVTRTFAAREEVEAWTRRLSSAPAPGPLATTPAMPSTRPFAGEPTEPPAARIDDSVREPSGISSSKVSRAPKGASGFLLGIGSLAVLAAAFAIAPRALGPKVSAPPPTTTPSERPSPALVTAEPWPAASTAPPAANAVKPSATLSAAIAANSSQKGGASTRTHESASSPSASAEPEQFGMLKITADPRAAVEVSGPHFHQATQSPVFGLKLPIGKYQVVFRNDTFGAPLSAQVTVLTGVTRSVHADFRQAEPAISVH